MPTPSARKIFASFLVLCFAIVPVQANETAEENPSCHAYRAKRQNVPVYREPDRASEVLGRLERSEQACGLSETKDFVAIVWKKPAEGENREKPSTGDPPRAYVRVVDLWPPKELEERDPPDAKEWLRLRQYGVVPDDPYAWLRPFLSFLGYPPQDIPGSGGGQP